jgi:hypothetical protein
LSWAEFTPQLDGLSTWEVQLVRSHPVIRYFLYRLSTVAERKALFPASEKYYLAQARLSDRRWKFNVRKQWPMADDIAAILTRGPLCAAKPKARRNVADALLWCDFSVIRWPIQ